MIAAWNCNDDIVASVCAWTGRYREPQPYLGVELEGGHEQQSLERHGVPRQLGEQAEELGAEGGGGGVHRVLHGFPAEFHQRRRLPHPRGPPPPPPGPIHGLVRARRRSREPSNPIQVWIAPAPLGRVHVHRQRRLGNLGCRCGRGLGGLEGGEELLDAEGVAREVGEGLGRVQDLGEGVDELQRREGRVGHPLGHLRGGEAGPAAAAGEDGGGEGEVVRRRPQVVHCARHPLQGEVPAQQQLLVPQHRP